MILLIAALLAATPEATFTAGVSAGAGLAEHDGNYGTGDGADAVAAAHAYTGVRVTGALFIVLIGHFGWTREQSADAEFPGGWAVHLFGGGAGLRLHAQRLALQVGAGAARKHLPHFHIDDSGVFFSGEASVDIAGPLVLHFGVVRWAMSGFSSGTTTVDGGLGVSF